MPELDPTSPYAHLMVLVREYRELTALIESRAYDTEEMLNILSDRQVTHDHIIEELARLGQPVQTREAALEKAEEAIRWYRLALDADEEE